MGLGASRGDAALGEEEIPRVSGPSLGLGSLVCWTFSFPAPSRGQCWEGGSLQLVSQPQQGGDAPGPLFHCESISWALILKMGLVFFDVVFQELLCIFALFVC